MKLLPCACILAAFTSLLQAEVREFKNNKGQILKAEPVVVRGMNVILRMENKQQVPVPLKNFSAEDQTWLLQWMVWWPGRIRTLNRPGWMRLGSSRWPSRMRHWPASTSGCRPISKRAR